MGRSPDEIRNDIEGTRQQAAEDAAEVQRRLDVPARGLDALRDLAEKAVRSLGGDDEAARSLGETVTRTAHTLEERPGLLAVVAAFGGLLLGRVTKRRRKRG